MNKYTTIEISHETRQRIAEREKYSITVEDVISNVTALDEKKGVAEGACCFDMRIVNGVCQSCGCLRWLGVRVASV